MQRSSRNEFSVFIIVEPNFGSSTVTFFSSLISEPLAGEIVNCVDSFNVSPITKTYSLLRPDPKVSVSRVFSFASSSIGVDFVPAGWSIRKNVSISLSTGGSVVQLKLSRNSGFHLTIMQLKAILSGESRIEESRLTQPTQIIAITEIVIKRVICRIHPFESRITSKITGSRQVIVHSITPGFATPVHFFVIRRSVPDSGLSSFFDRTNQSHRQLKRLNFVQH